YPVPEEWAKSAYINSDNYLDMYQRSISEPEAFWGQQAKEFLNWDKPWDKVCEQDFSKGLARWFDGGRLNVAVNCIDRHLATRAEQAAFIWEGDEPGQDKTISYRELHRQVS